VPPRPLSTIVLEPDSAGRQLDTMFENFWRKDGCKEIEADRAARQGYSYQQICLLEVRFDLFDFLFSWCDLDLSFSRTLRFVLSYTPYLTYAFTLTLSHSHLLSYTHAPLSLSLSPVGTTWQRQVIYSSSTGNKTSSSVLLCRSKVQQADARIP